MRPSVLYILYATSYHEQTGGIINFAQFEEKYLVGKKRNTENDESILASIDESSTDDDYNEGSVSTNTLK